MGARAAEGKMERRGGPGHGPGGFARGLSPGCRNRRQNPQVLARWTAMRIYTTQLSLFVICKPLLRLSSYLRLLGYPSLLLIFLPLSCTPYLSSRARRYPQGHLTSATLSKHLPTDLLGSLDAALLVPVSDLSSRFSSNHLISASQLPAAWSPWLSSPTSIRQTPGFRLAHHVLRPSRGPDRL